MTVRAIQAGVVIASLTSAAAADIYDFTFRGTIESVSGVAPPVAVGDDYEFRFRFDSATPDSDPAPNVGNYLGSISRIWVTVGSFEVVDSAPGDIFTLDNGFAGDNYDANIITPLSSAHIGMTNLSSTAFNSDSLPVDLILSQWDLRSFTFQRFVGPALWQADGNILDFESELVPGPATVVAIGAGIMVQRRKR